MIYLGLILGGLIANSLLALGALAILLGLSSVGRWIDLALLCVVVLLLDIIRKKCAEKWGIRTSAFILTAVFPSIVGSLVFFGVLFYLDSISYWAGQWFGGLREMLFGISYLICAIFILLGSLVLAGIRRLKKRV